MLDIVRTYRVARPQRMALGRALCSLDGHFTHHARLPADAGPHKQGDTIVLKFHNLRQVGSESFTYQPASLGQNFSQIIGPQS
jgi:hypothetical protein